MSTEFPQHPLPGPECAEMRELLPLLHSPDVDATEALRVRRHVAECAWCRQLLASYDAVDDALRFHFGGPASPFFSPEDFMNHLDAEEDTDPTFDITPLARTARPRARNVGRFTGVAALAAAVLVIVFAGLVFSQRAGLRGTGVGAGPTATTSHNTTVASPSTTATTGPLMYFGTSGANGSGGGLHAVNGGTGATVWNVTGPSFEIAPVQVNGVVYAISTNNQLYAVRAPSTGATGVVLWHVAVRQEAMFLLTDGHALYVGTPKTSSVSSDAHGFVDALDLQGHPLWTYGYDAGDPATCAMSTLRGTMTVGSGFIYVSGNCQQALVVGLRSTNGSVAFTIRSPYPAGARVSVGAGLVVVSGVLYSNTSTNGTGYLCAQQADTGLRIWCRQLSGADNMGIVAPVVAQGLVLASTDLDLSAVRASDGAPQWTVHVGVLLGQPVVAGMSVYVAGGDRTLRSYALAGRQVGWHFTMQGNGSDAVASSQIIYLHSYLDGTGTIIYALGATDGHVLWKHTLPTAGMSTIVIGS